MKNLAHQMVRQAIWDNNISEVTKILRANPSYAEISSEGSILEIAMESNPETAIIVFNQYKHTIPDYELINALNRAIEEKSFSFIKAITADLKENKDKYEDPNALYERMISNCISSSNSEILLYLLNENVIAIENDSKIKYFRDAAAWSSVEIIEILLERFKIDPESKKIKSAFFDSIQNKKGINSIYLMKKFDLHLSDDELEGCVTISAEFPMLDLLDAFLSNQRIYEFCESKDLLPGLKRILVEEQDPMMLLERCIENGYSSVMKLLDYPNLSLMKEEKIRLIELALSSHQYHCLDALITGDLLEDRDVYNILNSFVKEMNVSKHQIDEIALDLVKRGNQVLAIFFIDENFEKIGDSCKANIIDLASSNGDKSVFKHILQKYYKDDALTFHNLIYTTTPSKEEETLRPYTDAEKFSHMNIYYSYAGQYGKEYKTARGVRLDPDTPLYYNIYMPKGIPEAIAIHVYGGTVKGSRRKYPPIDEITEEQVELVKNGIAVIRLDLPDIYELETLQANMPKPLYDKLHQSINHFYKIIKESPDQLHADLSSLKSLRVILMGGSFGGGLAVSHASLYPGTFDGYISINGALDQSKEDASRVTSLFYSKPKDYLDPSLPQKIANLRDPILIMQTMDDNNVHAKGAFGFISKVKKLDKGHLLRLHISDSGRELPAKGDDPIHNKGHGFSGYRNRFESFLEAMPQFIKYGPAPLPAMNELLIYHYKKRANQYWVYAELKKKFVAQAIEHYITKQHELSDLNDEDFFNRHYKPMLDAYLVVDELTHQGKDTAPIKSELKRLVPLLSDETLSKLIRLEISNYIDYIQKRHHLELSSISSEELIEILIPAARQLMADKANSLDNKEGSKAAIMKLLTQLYTVDPTLLPSLNDPQRYKVRAGEYKHDLLTILNNQQKLALQANQEIKEMHFSYFSHKNVIRNVLKEAEDSKSEDVKPSLRKS